MTPGYSGGYEVVWTARHSYLSWLFITLSNCIQDTVLPQVLSLANLLRKITLQLYVVFLCMTGIPTSTMMSLQTGLIRSSSKTSHECNRVSPSRKWSSQLYPLKTKNKVITGQSNLGTYIVQHYPIA